MRPRSRRRGTRKRRAGRSRRDSMPNAIGGGWMYNDPGATPQNPGGSYMKAVAVFPKQPNTMHLAELPEPALTAVPGGRGVRVKMLRVGACGTDKEINAGEYGEAPRGSDFLVIGHENFGRVLEVGPKARGFAPGDYVVATVRRPGHSLY